MDDNVGGERDSSPTPAESYLRIVCCHSTKGRCLEPEGNDEAPVRSPRGPIGLNVRLLGNSSSITASHIPSDLHVDVIYM